MARRIGDRFGKILTWFRKLFRKGPAEGMGDKLVKFRRETIILTQPALVHAHVDHAVEPGRPVRGADHVPAPHGRVGGGATLVEFFAVYAFSRLLSAIPITPGGVGVIDLGYIAGLTAFDSVEKAQIVAAVSHLPGADLRDPVPLGAFTYVIWRRKSWMRDTPPPGSIAAELEPAPA